MPDGPSLARGGPNSNSVLILFWAEGENPNRNHSFPIHRRRHPHPIHPLISRHAVDSVPDPPGGCSRLHLSCGGYISLCGVDEGGGGGGGGPLWFRRCGRAPSEQALSRQLVQHRHIKCSPRRETLRRTRLGEIRGK